MEEEIPKLDNDDTDGVTRSAKARHPYTNDIITGFLVFNATAAFWGFGYAVYTGAVPASVIGEALGGISDPLIGKAVAAGILMMFIWLYGRGTVETLNRLRK